MSNRGLRRAKTARIKKQHLCYERQHGQWMRDRFTSQEIEATARKRAGMRTNTRTLCSCWMCRSPRKLYGNGYQALTFQECRQHDEASDQLQDRRS